MRFPRRALAETNENGGLTVRTELPWQSHKIACALGRFEATSKRFSSEGRLVRALRRELGGVNAHLLVLPRNSEQARCFDDPEHDGGEDASPERDDDAARELRAKTRAQRNTRTSHQTAYQTLDFHLEDHAGKQMQISQNLSYVVNV